MPKLSVIIPVYNASRYLRECLDSVVAAAEELEQAVGVGERTGLPLVEVICVNDGSTDGGGAILEEYKNSFLQLHTTPTPDFRIIHQANAGADVARNRALELARGEWITFLDSDDLLARAWFREAMRLADECHPDIVRLEHSSGERPTATFAQKPGNCPYEMHEGREGLAWALDVLFEFGYIWKCFVRAQIARQARFRPDIRCKEDGLWLVELLPHVKSVAQGTYTGYFYRLATSGSLTKRNRRVSQSVAYLNALNDIWLRQRGWAANHGLEESLRRHLRQAADHDVWEWAHLRHPADSANPAEIRATYRRLMTQGALWPRWCHRKRLLMMPMSFWYGTGSFIGLMLLERLERLGGMMRRWMR